MKITPKHLRYSWNFAKRGMSHLNLQLLYNCNFRCKICDFWHPEWQSKPKLSLEQVDTIMAKLRGRPPLLISIGGGEPLLHPQLVPIARSLCKDHFAVMICNGWFMTREKARELWEAGLYEVSISVDYLSPERHDTHRNMPGAHARAIEALKMLIEERVHPHQRVHMITVVMDDNLDDIEPLCELAESIGVTYLVTFHSTSRGRKEKRAAPAEVGARLVAIKKAHPKSFVALEGYLESYAKAGEDGEIKPCRAGKNLFNIDCTGAVSTCIDRLDEPVGNILEDDVDTLFQKLSDQQKASTCGACWTSCRGPVETMMYGKERWRNFWDMDNMLKDVPLVNR